MSFERVLVVGAGQMGAGIAQVVAASGREVLLHDAMPGAVDRGLETMRRSLAKLHEKGGPAPDEVLARVTAVDELGAADLLIEAIVENAEAKKELFRAADAALPPEAVLASNTSSIPITELAAATSRPERVDRHAFLQPGPDARARRGDPRGADLGRDRRGDRPARARSREDARGGERLPRVRLEPDPHAVHQRGGVRR